MQFNLIGIRRSMVRVWLVVAFSLVLLSAASLANAQAGPNDALLAEGQKNQVIQFNPTAALQKRIFADRFVPNSSEFSLAFSGTEYAAQRAENLGNGQVRVYFVQVGDWGNVRTTTGGDALGDALVAQGQQKQVIQFNPGAALQKQIFADGFVPNSAEFGAQIGGVGYTAQRAENLANGQVRVYYVQGTDYGNVRIAGAGAPAAPPQVAAPPPAPSQGPTTVIQGETAVITEGDTRLTVLRNLPPPPAELVGTLQKRVDEATVQLVVLTRTDAGIATGTVVGNDGHTILTAFHVVGNLETGKVNDPLLIAVGPFMNYTLRATVIASDAANDLAVIRITRRPDFGGFTFLPLADSNTSQVGEPAHIFSYPARGEGGLGRSRGTLLGISEATSGGRRVFLTDAVASPGSSGGVVVNNLGQVMGIISFGVRLPRGIDRPGLPTITSLTGFMPINLAKPLLQ